MSLSVQMTDDIVQITDDIVQITDDGVQKTVVQMLSADEVA